MKRLFKFAAIFFGIALLVILIIVLINWRRDRSPEELNLKYGGPESRFLDLAGMVVHYRDEGNPVDSLPLVLLHGTGASLHTWQGWVDSLKPDYRVIRLDLPAFGLTGPNPARDYSMDFYVDFLLEFLDRLQVDRFVLGGNSLGGGIAWRTALAAPDRVAGLVLVDAAGYPVASESRPLAFQLAGLPGLRSLFRYVTPRSVVEKSVLNVYGNPEKVTPELVDRYYEFALREGNRQAFLDRMSGGLHWGEEYKRISSIQSPTLILWGGKDRLIPPAAARRFREDLPNDTMVIFEALGHVPMEEDPGQTAPVVEGFLQKVNGR